MEGHLPETINMVPRTPPTSTIIRRKLVTIMANWIDKNDSNVLSLNDKFRFNLIYLKSRDGFDCTAFYNQCNIRRPLLILIKVQSKKIYGGYNPIGYASRKNAWLTSSDSFIFSFEDDQDIYNMKIGRVINTRCAIFEDCNKYFFACGYDLYTKEGQYLQINHYQDSYYENIANSNHRLLIEEIEVLRVVKK
jgi:hypothetical protein